MRAGAAGGIAMSWLKIFRPVSVDMAKEPAPKDTGTIPPPALRPLPVPGPVVVAKVERARLVLAVDATGSRAAAWETARQLTDVLLATLPGELDVALAVHGGGRVHTFTGFTANADTLRKKASRVRCIAGRTALLDVLASVLKLDVRVVVYIGDVFEESSRKARRLAEALMHKNTRVIILHDGGSPEDEDGQVFQMIASITTGAVMPFDADAIDELGELLQAIAVLAVGGTELVEEKRDTLPAAPVLLERLAESKQLLLGNGKR
jgi:hypothetical protein